jgi:hypothetical protein
MTTARKIFAAGALNGGATIVVVGGMTSGSTSGPTELYDVATHVWSAGAAMPVTGGVFAGATIDNIFYVVGGSCGVSGAFGQAYRPGTPGPSGHPDGWGLMPTMLTGRLTLAVAADGGNLFAMGGSDQANIALKTLEVFSAPPAGDWNFTQDPFTCSGGIALPAAADDFDPSPLVTANPASGSTFPLGATTVTVTATDGSGNSAPRRSP